MLRISDRMVQNSKKLVTFLQHPRTPQYLTHEETGGGIQKDEASILTEATFTKSSSERVSNISETEVRMSFRVNPLTLPLL